jgi:unspecific monooxygenase
VAAARRHVAQVAPIRAEREAGGAWHTKLAPPPSPLPDVAPRRAERPLYAAAAGGDVTGEVLDGRYWRWLARRPFYLDEAATAAVEDGYLAVVDVGGSRDVPAAIKAEARARGRIVRVFDRPPPPRQTRRRRSRPGPPSLLDPAFHEELRRDGPVHHLADRDVWLVVGYDEARAVLADPDRFSSRPFAVYDRSLLSLDPPAHTPPRRTVRDILSPARVAELAQVSERIAGELVASVAEEPEFDVLAQIARPLSERVIAHVLGIEPSAVPDLAAAAAGGGHEADFALTEQALASLPRPPALTPTLAAAPGIDSEQAAALVRLLWVAGSVTTRRLIGVALLTLCEHQDARARVTEDPELLPAFVEETLRLRPPEHLFPRVAVRDTSLAGVPIPAGANVRVSLRAANRDPKHFPEPDRLRLDRPPRHLAFGAGPHRCPGARLGRVEALAALREILRAMPDVALAQPPSTIRWLEWQNSPVLEELVVSPSPPV